MTDFLGPAPMFEGPQLLPACVNQLHTWLHSWHQNCTQSVESKINYTHRTQQQQLSCYHIKYQPSSTGGTCLPSATTRRLEHATASKIQNGH